MSASTAPASPIDARYASCIEASKRIRWDIDRDVIRGRTFDVRRKFLPDGLARMGAFGVLSEAEKRLLSQIQGRTYANMFALVERYIVAKLLDVTRGRELDDQVVLEALLRSTDEELKHQALFRRLESMMAEVMPPGYAFVLDPNAVAEVVLSKRDWAVLALTCHIELFTLDHYRQSIDKDTSVSELWKDVFLFHMREESQHAILDELEWRRADALLTPAERDASVDDFIALVGAVDGLLQAQCRADAEYFAAQCGRKLASNELEMVRDGLLRAYRWQYIVSGARNERFTAALGDMLAPAQLQRIGAALAPIAEDAMAGAH